MMICKVCKKTALSDDNLAGGGALANDVDARAEAVESVAA